MHKTTPKSIAPPSPGTRFTLHYIGQEAVLLDEAAQRLYALNATAAFIWTCLEQGMPPQGIADRLRAAFRFAPAESQAHVQDVMKAWYRLSVVAIPDPVEHSAAAKPGRNDPAAPDTRIARTFRLLDSTFRLRLTSAEQAEEVARAFAMMAEERATADPIVVDVVTEGVAFALRVGGAIVDRCPRADQVLPMIRARLVELALHHSRDLFAIHTAALSRDGRCLLLPGAAGSGKSTLAAALAAEGFGLVGDDTVALTRDAASIRPMALPICLKEGAWPLLIARYPELEALPIYTRSDGKRVRYVLPPTRSAAVGGAVSWIVFPRRTDATPPGLATLSKQDGLARLMPGLCPLGPRLNAGAVGRFARWIEDIAFFELRYFRLDEGVSELAALCA